MLYTDSLMVVKDLLYFHKDHPLVEWQNYEDLIPFLFGRTFGFQYGKEFEGAAKRLEFNIEEAPTDLINFRKLAYGRIDAFIVIPPFSTLKLNSRLS